MRVTLQVKDSHVRGSWVNVEVQMREKFNVSALMRFVSHIDKVYGEWVVNISKWTQAH